MVNLEYPSLKSTKNKKLHLHHLSKWPILGQNKLWCGKDVYFERSHNALLHQNVMVFSFSLTMHTPNIKQDYYPEFCLWELRSQVKASLLYCIINQKQNGKNKSSETCEEENWRKQMTYRAHFLRELHPAPPARGPSAGRGCPRYSRPCEGRWVKHPPLNIPQAAEEKSHISITRLHTGLQPHIIKVIYTLF